MERRSDTLGLTVFVLSDACLFAALLVSCLLVAAGAADFGALASTGGILSLLLLGSSAALEVARKKRVALPLAAGLGLAFCIGQALEWRALFARGFTLAHSNRADGFYALTGFHGLHVAAGVLWMLALVARRDRDIAALAIYWHFVGGVWLAIYLFLYIL